MLIITDVKRLRTVWVERTAQEPKTAYSGELGAFKFSLRAYTQLEIVEGHLFSIFRRDFPASLKMPEKN